MKKNYQKPTMNVVQLQHQGHILQGSPYSMETTGRRNQLEDDTESLDW